MWKYTPGPWVFRGNAMLFVRDTDSHAVIRIGQVTVTERSRGYVAYRDQDEVLANGYLAAAAPQLLEVALRAKSLLPMAGDQPEILQLITDIDHVIGKARGDHE